MRKQSVIVADDDEEIQRLVERLIGADYDIVAAVQDGRGLLEAASRLEPDAAIVDINMPAMTGFEAVEQFKVCGLKVRVVFFTTNGHHAYVKRAFRVGASAYVLKAAAGEDLRPALQAALNGDSFVSPSVGYRQPAL